MPKNKRPRVICDDSDEEEFDVHLVSGNSNSILDDSKLDCIIICKSVSR